MSKLLPTCLTVAMLLIATLVGLHVVTHGFHAITSDQARQRTFAESPRVLPAIRLVDSHGQPQELRRIASARPYTVVSLVYTQCTSLCLLTASSEAYLQAKLLGSALQRQVGLVTISFDPARDTPDALADYARRVRADPALWTIATVEDSSDLDDLLDAFGIIVLPDGAGGYTHNGALFIVDERGRVFDALDPDAADRTFDRLSALVEAR